jgi:HD superfamily phosphodiesterase
MIKPKIPKKYYKIWEEAVPYLKKCRSGDLEHCARIAEEVFRLGENKNLDLDVLIPVAIFHDIGHSVILPEHFYLISGPKKEQNSKLVHMLTGAKIAKDILIKLDYPADKIKKIVELITIHDNQDKNLFDSEEKIFFHDLDRMDRFSEYTIKTAKDEFGLEPKEALIMLEEKLLPDLIRDDFRDEARKKIIELKKKIF